MKKVIAVMIMMWISFLWSATTVPFHRGVNFTNWFQAGSPTEIPFNRFTRQDIRDIKRLGCDVVRLPMNLHAMVRDTQSWELDPLFLYFLDQVVQWFEEEDIHLILDNHTFDPAVNTLPSVIQPLTAIWPQIAQRYKDRSRKIYYEILNEPHGISDAEWGAIQEEVIRAIRQVDTVHTIIVGPANWNSYQNLRNLPQYTDTNLIYTFHFYDPFLFTHQGATWTSPSLQSLAGVPFPYDPARMPACPADLRGTWVESALNSYPNEGTVQRLQDLLYIARQFQQERNVPVFCGEFGVFIPNSPEADRVTWYKWVRIILENYRIPWTIWDYRGGFGLFEKNTPELFDYHLNVPLLQALGLEIPEQSEWVPRPDSASFPMYGDFPEKGISFSAWIPNGRVSLYDSLYPAAGKFAICWTGGDRYSHVTFHFIPDRDFTRLLSMNARLRFQFRSLIPDLQLDVRFLDTKTGDSDHPWRMNFRLSNDVVPMDGQWHEVVIPLSQFREGGSWDNGTWYEPQGLFDWSAIDAFQLVAEYSDLPALSFWVDELWVEVENPVTIDEPNLPEKFALSVYPNPFNGSLTIGVDIPVGEEKAAVSILNVLGQPVRQYLFSPSASGYQEIRWEGKDEKGRPVSSGIYFIRFTTGSMQKTVKVVYNK